MKNNLHPLQFDLFPSSNNDLDQKYVWQLWILKTSGKGLATEISLFYSWITSSHLEFNGWKGSAVEFSEEFASDQDKKFRIDLIHATYYGTGIKIQSTIAELYSKYLSEIKWGDEGGTPPNDFLNLTLAPALNKGPYVARPEVLLPVEHSLIPWANRSIPSPVGYSVFVTQIFNLNKVAFFEKNSELLPKIIIKKLAASFEKATGFDITTSSAPRIGNIEWYRLPVSDNAYRSLVSFAANNTGEDTAQEAIVYLEPLPQGTPEKNISVRCRIMNGEEVTMDMLRDVVWSDKRLMETFSTNEPVSEIAVTVWENSENGKCSIVFENSHVCIRQISTNMSIIGSTINSGRINMLDKLRGKEEKSKPQELAQFSRSSKGLSSEIGSYEQDPWVEVSRGAIKFMQVLFPKKSSGRFFLNGWDEQKEASGQLSFLEWMLKTISGERAGGLILLDPFFDKDGIEIFSNARTTNTEFCILTCTQHREKDSVVQEGRGTTAGESEPPTNAANQHAAKLIAVCHAMRPLLRGLDFRLLDIKSKAGGKKQLFHDRYMLLTDAAGKPVKGFHLSNSIQGATRNEPLLITPIPDDTLLEVLDYVTSLIDSGNEQHKRQTEITTLYSSKEDSTNNRHQRISANSGDYIDQIPNAGFFFSRLLADDSLTSIPKEDLLAVLTERRLYSRENHFHIYNVTPEHIECFFQFVCHAEQKECNELLSAWGNMLARGHSFDHSKINNSESSVPYDAQKVAVSFAKQYSSLAERIVRYLDGFNDSQQLIDDRGRFYSIFKNEGFEGSLIATTRSLNYMSRDCFVLDYGLMYASKLLVKAFPTEALNFLDTLISQAEAGGWNEGSSSVRARLRLLTAMASHILSYGNRINIELQEKLLTDKNESVRAAGVAALHSSLPISYREGRLVWDTVVKILKRTLSDKEFRVAIAFFLSNLEVQNNATELVVKERLFSSLLNEFHGDIYFIINIVRILGGTLPFNRAQFVTKNFLDPLVSQGVLNHQEAYGIWNDVFVNKIKYRAEYRDNGSRDYDHSFCSNSDTELTVALLNTFLALPIESQSYCILEWIAAVKNIWPVVNRPFAESNYQTYSESAERLFWVHFVIKTVYESGRLSLDANEVAESFLQQHSTEMKSIIEFIRNRNHPGVKDIETITVVTEPEVDSED